MEQLFSVLHSALPSIASFMVISVITYFVTKLKNGKFNISKFMKEHEEVMNFQKDNYENISCLKNEIQKINESIDSVKKTQRNDVKSHIVSMYERCSDRGYITPMELETVNRLSDSYHNDLDGNTYIHVIVGRMNTEMPIKGTAVPEH